LRPPSVPPPIQEPTPAPEEVAALARVKELEARLQAIEAEKAQAEAAAAEEARLRLEAEAARKGRAVDRAAVARAQEEAAREARAEQEQRQEAEKRKIAEEMQAEEARLQAARAAAATEPSPSPTAPSAAEVATSAGTPATTVAPAVPTTAVAAPSPGGPAPGDPNAPLVHAVGAPGVKAPVLQKSAPVEYPQLARATRVQGAVVVSALIDEKGRVSEARAVSPGNEILRQAAVAHVLQRQYAPGQKDGVPVKVRILVHVNFKFQN
jgi:TonB family protein